MVFCQSNNVHQVIVCGDMGIKCLLTALLCHLLFFDDTLPKLGLLTFSGHQCHAIAKAEALFRNIRVPCHRIPLLHCILNHTGQIPDGEVQESTARKVVRHFENEAFAKFMVGETRERNIVAG